MLCNRCGSPDLAVATLDYAYCEACETDFQAAMAREFPNGQCYQCGARYEATTCGQDKVHTWAMHSEGGCSNWSDSGEPPDDAAVALGACSYGCRPAPEAWGAYFAAVEAARFVVLRFVDKQPQVIAAALAGTLDSRDPDADYDLPF
jgi:ribosomal protein L40E